MSDWRDLFTQPDPQLEPDRPDPTLRMRAAAMFTALAMLAYALMGSGPAGDWYLNVSVGKVQVEAGRRTISVRVGSLPASTGWPDATNTGVPTGTTLTAYTGSCTITTPNTTIDSKTVDCPDGMAVQAANLTIIRSRVNGLVRLDPDSPAYNTSWSMTITDSEIIGGNVQQAGLCCGNMDVLRTHLRGGQTDAQCEESLYCRIRDSYLSDIYRTTENWHLGAFLSDGTAGPGCTGVGGNGLCIELTHNTLWCDAPYNGNADHGCSGDLQLIPNFNFIRKVKITNNYFRANIDAAFCTFGGDKSTSPFPHASDVTYDSNVFERGTNNRCASFGPVTGFNVDGVRNVWTNNTYEDGTPVDPSL
jgi:hypothetical protein